MSVSLNIQLIVWAAAAMLSALVLVEYLNFIKKAKRLPQACEHDDLEQRLELKRQDLKTLDARAGEAQKVIGASLQKVGEVKEAQDWLSAQRSELLKVESERKLQESLRSELKSQQAHLENLTAEMDRVNREVISERANMTYMSTQKANLDGEMLSLKEQLAQMSQQVTDKALALNAVTNDLNLKTVDLSRLQDQLDTTTQYLAKAKEQFDAVISETNLAKQAQTEMEIKRHALAAECERLQEEIDSLKTWKETLTTLLKKLQTNVDNLDPQTAGANRYKDLWEPCKFAPLPPVRGSQNELKALDRTELYLKSHGLHYPRRVLYAFHTALKTADMSPLVVLAGISGTGKSLLPKRYAEAMGMHMVTLAVQPRWDSPQDLLGFFNHLERRYKASDLARAMVQFERHNRDSWAMPSGWNHGREDRMLLVLLDEMNLARVEYYFSEFLSKLETRREIDEQDDYDRAKAEITLDMGSLTANERNISLYPGRNILFTGTMNEDESTQSLSDKVIDRACVLRFGRPQKLEVITKNEPIAAEANGLTMDIWSGWCDAGLTSADERKMNGWVGELNEGMDMLGKPFAHRVHKAIISYAGHYPMISGNDRLKLALADQIEQRILPKLRGVELDGNEEAMEAIKKVILKAEDNVLTSAFEKAMDQRSSTFLWRGLDRTDR